MGCDVPFSSFMGKNLSYFRNVETAIWAHLAYYPFGTGVHFPRG
jgi:hypothetical protein